MLVLSNDPGLTPSAQAGGGEPAASRSYARPYWIGAGIIAMGAVWLYGALQLPLMARYAAVGPGLVVIIVGAGLVLLGALLTFQIWRGERFEPQDAEDAAANSPMDKRAFIIALIAVILPVGLMGPLGMPLTATISFALVCMAFGSRRWWLDLIYGAILACAAWYLFTRLGLQLGRFFPPLGF